MTIDGRRHRPPRPSRYRHDGERHELRCRHRRRLRRLPRRLPRPHRARTCTRRRAGATRSPGSASWPRPRRRIDELIYANHERGFALYSMRSPTVTRLYLQVPADERIEDWSDDRIWSELRRPPADRRRLHAQHRADPRAGHHRRCAASSPRRCATGNLLLAGDAAHIVPPTGRQGHEPGHRRRRRAGRGASTTSSRGGRTERLDDYTATCLRRVWRAQHFSWWMTSMLHRFGDDPFQPPAAARRAGARHGIDGGGHQPRRELRRPRRSAVAREREPVVHRRTTGTRSPRRPPAPTRRSTARTTGRRRCATRPRSARASTRQARRRPS